MAATDQTSRDQATLSDASPTARERVIATGVIATSIAAFLLMAPFARIPLPRTDAFVPAYEAALAICDLITAVLLFGQFARSHSRALLILACAYLFNVLLIVPHALTFPGVFAASGLLGAGPQTAAWLYCFWHGGFALLVVAYALQATFGKAAARGSGADVAVAASCTVAIAVALTVLAILGQDLLPVIISGADYSMLITKGVSPAICVISMLALGLLWRRRRASVLDLWLFVVMSVWLCDVLLSAVVGSSRFDLGWYGGRSYGLLAASFLLVMLLSELNRLYAKLAQALAYAETRNVELAKSRDDLAHAQRLEAMGQLTGGVAHDFNNLLMIITGSMDLILRSPGNAAKVERFARAALEASDRGQKLTQQLLTFARKQVINPVAVNPNRLLSDLKPLLQRATGETFTVETRLDPDIDAAIFDPAQFEAAILNLVVNARDASPAGGRVVISAANASVADSAAPGGVSAGEYVLVSVSDQGSGMTPEIIAKAFDPFFTTKGVGRGSGLGLSQVYGFVKSAAGHVRIISEAGRGTTIQLYLPKSLERLAPAVPRLNTLPLRAARGGEVILAVEDDEDVLELAVSALNDLGYSVLTATNAAEALDILRSANRLDVLFSDVIMPGGMNGAQLAVEARRIRPDLKVLLTSGYTAEALAHEHGLPDDLLVLGKPYRHEDLANKIRLVMNG
jgi:signal transduction histidine kinase/CheY-like chemotaxis protein